MRSESDEACSSPPPPSPLLQAARTDGPSTAAAAAAALPPMKRLREVRFDASRAKSRGSISRGMATVPFVGFLGKGDGLTDAPSRVVEHLLEVLGGGYVGGRKHERSLGCPADVHLVT